MEFSQNPVVVIGDKAQLTDPVWANAESHPDLVQFVTEGKEITCSKFRDQVADLASGLVAAGIRPGDRVALWSKTRYEWTLIDYAILAAGAVTVPVYETSSPDQARWILQDSGAVALFLEDHLGVPENTPDLGNVWRIGSDPLPSGTAP